MGRARNRGGLWQSVRELPERTPLRAQLITAVLVLVAIALAMISFVGISVLRDNLIGTVDNTLFADHLHIEGELSSGGLNLQSPQEAQVGEAVTWVPDHGNPVPLVIPVSSLGYAPGSYGQQLPGPSLSASEASSLPPSTPVTVASATGDTRWRVVGIPSSAGAVDGTVVVAVDATSEYRTIGALTVLDLLLSVLIMLAVALVGVAVVRASLRPLLEIEQTAGAIAAGDLTKRVPERDSRTEVGRLGHSLNVMLSQIEAAFHARSRSEESARRSEERMRQFVGDASHDLRTPLTAIRGFAEYYRQRGGVAVGEAAAAADTTSGDATGAATASSGGRHARRPLAPADMDRIMRRVEQESARMGVLVEDMLLLARLDQQRPLTASPVDLLSLAADAVHDARVVAPARTINLHVSSNRALLIIGDEVRLRQVIGNLMTNAITHTPEGTPIDVVIRSGDLDEAAMATAVAWPDLAGEDDLDDDPDSGDGAADGAVRWDADHVPPPPGLTESAPRAGRAPSGPAAVLEVIDQGPGLTREQAEHVFERFYRADAARTTGGTGLGLAIVAALVAAHGGAAWVRSRPGEGATFCIALPLAPEATQAPENDFDDEADEINAETGAVENGASENGASENGASENGPAQNGPARDDPSETRSGETWRADPGTAYTASAGAELGGWPAGS